MEKVHGYIMIFALAAMPLASYAQENDFQKKLNSLYQYTVPLIKPEEVAKLVEQGGHVVFLDIRSPEEYMVSHLPGAYFLDYRSFEEGKMEKANRDIKIIVYCTVGYRSEHIGERLMKMGFRQVYNLYGGILHWKNTGHPLANMKGEKTDSVHTYNRDWSKWLVRGIKVY